MTSIGQSAFYNCDKLQFNEYDNALYLGNATNKYVALIWGKSYESDKSDITSCTINKNTKTIADKAFTEYTSLTSVTIPDSVTSIGQNAFYGCTGLTSITIPDSVTVMGGYASFGGCTGLTSVTIPDSVTSIGQNTFSGCTSLTSITFNGTRAQWEAIDKASGWNYNTGTYVVHCTDGDIAE